MLIESDKFMFTVCKEFWMGGIKDYEKEQAPIRNKTRVQKEHKLVFLLTV